MKSIGEKDNEKRECVCMEGRDERKRKMGEGERGTKIISPRLLFATTFKVWRSVGTVSRPKFDVGLSQR